MSVVLIYCRKFLTSSHQTLSSIASALEYGLASSKNSDHSLSSHLPSLIRLHFPHEGMSLATHRALTRPDGSPIQADPSIHWVHNPNYYFCYAVAQNNVSSSDIVISNGSSNHIYVRSKTRTFVLRTSGVIKLMKSLTNMSWHIWALSEENLSSGFLSRSYTNWTVQQQSMARGLKLWI